MDVVYPLRRGTGDGELRYSLRSLAENLPHARVWLAGFRPGWVSDEVGHLPGVGRRHRFLDSTANVAAACAHPEVSESFLLMNDDFFVLRPMTGIPVLHRGPLEAAVADYAARGASGVYLDGMRATGALLAELGHPAPMSYELHVPMVVHGPTMGRLLEEFGGRTRCLHKRTLYGNVAHCGGTRAADVKVHRPGDVWDPAGPFLSTSDRAFVEGGVGEWLRARFAAPCRYERTDAPSGTPVGYSRGVAPPTRAPV